MKLLDGEIHPGDQLQVDADSKTGEMKITRGVLKAGAA
jgi:hypothetical protein